MRSLFSHLGDLLVRICKAKFLCYGGADFGVMYTLPEMCFPFYQQTKFPWIVWGTISGC